MTTITVLDKGYVRLADTLGTDLSVVNAARVSYDKESSEFNEKDDKLLKFLLREKHFSPLRHAALTFEVYMPLIVARQWWKHVVASTYVDDQAGWNESSRRYITENEEFYIPAASEWRSKPENSKQGSGDFLPADEGMGWSDDLCAHVDRSLALYDAAMEAGIAPEQARLFLPAYGLYVRSRWTTSLAAVIHFLSQRLDSHAQKEIRDYANAVYKLVKQQFPKTMKAVEEAGLLGDFVPPDSEPVFVEGKEITSKFFVSEQVMEDSRSASKALKMLTSYGLDAAEYDAPPEKGWKINPEPLFYRLSYNAPRMGWDCEMKFHAERYE